MARANVTLRSDDQFCSGDEIPLYALLAYAKSARTDLTLAERRTVSALAAAIGAVWRERK